MKLAVFLSAISLTVTSQFAFADETKIPKPFQGDTPDSKFEVSYDDLSAFLRAEVLDVGRSTREKAPKEENTGTRVKSRRNRLTALEANRFYFAALEDDEVANALEVLQDSLEALPDAIPLSYLSKNEQLAYWLNLYNFTIISEIAKINSPSNLEDELDPDDSDNILTKKILNVAGVPLSLNDIHYTILKEKYPASPTVIYGLFQGNIGGPSILPRAFEGKSVWHQLEKNADEFVNSNRGIYRSGRISVFYERNMPFFDNSKEKLKDHLLSYVENPYYDEIMDTDADDLEFDMKDWQIANMTGGARKTTGSGMINNAALLGATQVEQALGNEGQGAAFSAIPSNLGNNMVQKARIATRLPAAQVDLLLNLRKRNDMNAGKVDITDLSEEEAKGSSDEQN